MNKIIIFHVFPDDKFFDGISDFYDNLKGVENRYYFYVKDRNYHFKYIKNINKVKTFHNVFTYINELRKRDVDVVLFHRMVGLSFAFALLLRKKTKIIWWAWGYDLYSWRNFLPPIIPLELYKTLTNEHVDVCNSQMEKNISFRLGSFFLGRFYAAIRKKAISRIDLFMPCLPIEFDLIKSNCPYFHGKVAINPNFTLTPFPKYCRVPGNILIGNSLSYTNNHLDIFEYLYRVNLMSGRKFVIPVSYGNAFGGPDNLIRMTHFNDDECIWLKDFLSKEEYTTLFGTITHAVFGTIRQQALGNIFICFVLGIKVYLYKDSIAAQQFSRDGYVFFTIEDDLTTESLKECLSKEQADHNYKVYTNSLKGRGSKDVYGQLCQLLNKSI